MSQDEQLDACREKVMEILTSDEAITFSVAQTPIAGFKPDIVVLTNKRFILYHPGILGCRFDDFLWRDVTDVKLEEGILGAKLIFEAKDFKMSVDKLPKTEARKLTQWLKKRSKKLLRIGDKGKCRRIQQKQGILFSEMSALEHSHPVFLTTQWQS